MRDVEPELVEADYVIVGGGTAGCVVASRLSEDPAVHVAMVEAGPDYRGLPIHIPAAFGNLYRKGAYHWPYRSSPEPFAAGQSLPYKMGKLVGGSSAINGMVWVRGNPLDFDDWVRLGCDGWGADTFARLFRKIEAFSETDEGMGHDGPIPVSRSRPERQRLNRAFIEAAMDAGYPFNPNYNVGDQFGVCALHQNSARGRRGDVYEGYIRPIKSRPNLRIYSRHLAAQLELSGRAAIGVIARSEAGVRRFRARREMILAAGSIATPQLLENSGIGDPEILQAKGVRPVLALQGVGENLHTHPTISLAYTANRPVSILPYTRPIGRLRAGLEWLVRRSGPAASTHFEAGAFLKSSSKLLRPDLELTFFPLALRGTAEIHQGHGFQIYVELIGVKSRGSVHIRSPDVTVSPDFRFNFLKDPRDVDAFRSAVKIVRHIISKPPFDDLRGVELAPGEEIAKDEEIDDWIKRAVGISHHLVGSCRMGSQSDPQSVVGPDLRVRGIDRLRIIDASIMPVVVSGNTHAAVIAIAERGSELLRGTPH